MKTMTFFTLVLFDLLFSGITLAQYDPDKICRVEDGRVIFTLNLKWTEKERKELSDLFDLDSILIAQVYSGKTVFSLSGDTWKVKKTFADFVELSKAVGFKMDKSDQINDLFLVIDKWMNFKGNVQEAPVVYGINNFELSYVFAYGTERAQFYLPTFKSAGKVYISGSFNGWSTSGSPMKAVSEGWMVDLKLKPGKYLYKYIVDGKWTPDPNNNLRERDGSGGYNSVLYCCNHLFRLKGYTNAHKVVVTGNFCDWNPRGIKMNKTDSGWSLPIFLRDGTYSYKFLVDNQWMTDPENKTVRNDGNGNLNSFIGIGEPYIFKLDGFTNASKIILTGSFNGWNESELVMDKTDKGWQFPYVVAAGNYEYKFIVDGKWMLDPANPFSTGSGDAVNSFIALKTNHLFELNKFPDAQTIIVTGSFNGWKTDGYKMTYQGGKWILPLFLAPGKYTYKFIVDGTWILDPLNTQYEQNEYETDNSVLWVEP